jgi:phosphatidylglycerol:prolipoprotein diacylglycerol transferase
MSFHGGFLGVMTAIAIFARRTGKRVWDVFDFAAPLPGLGIIAVRIGNFINGELWGRPTDAWYGFQARDSFGNELGVRHASQLYEATLEGLVLFLLVWFFTRRARPRYAASALFLILYALARMTVEFVRVPDLQLGYLYLGWVTMGQLLSLPMLLTGLYLACRAASHPEPSGNRGA